MKSKQQKQQEALERNRKAFPRVVGNWVKRHTAMTADVIIASERGDELAKGIVYLAEEAEKRLVSAAANAKVDRYGNPLEAGNPLNKLATLPQIDNADYN